MPTMEYTSPANLSLEGVDLRVGKGDSEQEELAEMTPEHYKPTMEESMYYAAIQRQQEAEDTGAVASYYVGLHRTLFSKKKGNEQTAERTPPTPESVEKVSPVTQGEKDQARRALRTAGWISVFYLITTDILGPGSAPWAFSQLG